MQSPTNTAIRQLLRVPAGRLGLVIVIVFGILAIFAPALAPYSPFELVHDRLMPPGSDTALLGSDQLGRDILSQLLYGARVSVLVGLLAAGLGLVIGVTVGALSGYFGGRADALLMRVLELFQLTPDLILALAIIALLGPGIDRVIFVIGVLSWPPSARVIRAEFLSLRERPFAEACRVIGLSRSRIIFGELLPNALPAAIVIGSLDIARAILIETGLSFLGLGDPDVMSWGMMLNNAQMILRLAPWLSIFPGLAVFALVLGFNLLGDGVNEILDPKQRLKRKQRLKPGRR